MGSKSREVSVHSVRRTQPLVEHLYSPSLFYNKNFSEAALSFRKACRYREAAIADAYNLKEQARLTKSSNSIGTEKTVKAYKLAAEALQECAENTNREKQMPRQRHFKAAADCWIHAGEFVIAAKTYMKASKYELCVDAYRRAGMFDEAVEVVEKHRSDINLRVWDDLRNEACRFYFRVSLNSN
jgi:tetratricopeptide (TPR) repeat protein